MAYELAQFPIVGDPKAVLRVNDNPADLALLDQLEEPLKLQAFVSHVAAAAVLKPQRDAQTLFIKPGLDDAALAGPVLFVGIGNAQVGDAAVAGWFVWSHCVILKSAVPPLSEEK
jgi:hypothetical protein